MAERRFTGIAASPGLAIGPLFLLGAAEHTREKGTPQYEKHALAGAITQAGEQLQALIASQDELAAEILEFQVALLDDDELNAPVYARIAEGVAADQAWLQLLELEIADYQSADDDYMAARASDLCDLKDRVLTALLGNEPAESDPPEDAILLAEDLPPSAFLAFDWRRLGGVVLSRGSITGHTAILARGRGVPMVVGLGTDLAQARALAPAVLDAEAGSLIIDPAPEMWAGFEAKRDQQRILQAQTARIAHQPARTAAGDPIAVLINLDDPAMLSMIDPATCDGVGLVRTEFLCAGGYLPTEEDQFSVYRRIIAWADRRSVTFRTIDAGGDKPVPGFTIDGEANPFLGVRGLRLSLLKPETLLVQFRALARAAAFGPLKIMLPMVTLPTEFHRARALLDRAIDELVARGADHARPALGIMVETPAAALQADMFAADFYSIGSNDLIQYVTACARDNPLLHAIASPLNPAVLELIGRVIEVGRERAVEVSLCGDMASDPDSVAILLGLGLTVFSTAPAQIGRIKAAIASVQP